VDHLVERCRKPVLQALKDAKVNPSQIDEVVMVGGMTRMPKIQWLVKDVFGKEGHRGVNPDEVVAIGAAIQGAQLLLGSKSEVLLVDVTPLTLGIETEGGILDPVIEKNTSIPKEAKKVYSTAADGQTAVTVSVFQGESQIARGPANRLLGEFNLTGIPPQPRGMPKIEVVFSIDKNGILQVTAKDLGTQKEAKIEIKGSSGLDPKEVERMRKEADSHAAEDRRKVEVITARNQAEQAVYAIEKLLKEHESKLGASEKGAIQGAVERTKQAAAGEDVQAIRQAVSDLQAASHSLAQFVQQGGSGGPDGADGAAGGPTPGAKQGPDDVIDAEFEVKK